jgi:hypothetical protein
MTGARVQLFASQHTPDSARDVARRLGLTIAELPMEHESLTTLLHELPGDAP